MFLLRNLRLLHKQGTEGVISARLQFSSFHSSVAVAEASSSLVLLPLLSPFLPPPSLLFFSLLSLLFRGFKFSTEKAARLTIQVKHLTLKSDTDPLRSWLQLLPSPSW